jgi:hypothetical protein
MRKKEKRKISRAKLITSTSQAIKTEYSLIKK